MSRFVRSQRAIILAGALLVASLATDAFAGIDSPTEYEQIRSAPKLPILAPTFRAQVLDELKALPDEAEFSSAQLKAFGQLAETSPYLDDIARAPYFDWIARTYLHRDEPLNGLSYAKDAYRLRRRSLGTSHPLSQSSAALIEALENRVQPARKLAQPVKIIEEAAPLLPIAEHARARAALVSGDRSLVEISLEELNADQRISGRNLDSLQNADDQLLEESVLVAELLVMSDQLNEATRLLKNLNAIESSQSGLDKPATLLLSDLLFEAGRLNDCGAKLKSVELPATKSKKYELVWRKLRLKTSRGLWDAADSGFRDAVRELSELDLIGGLLLLDVQHHYAESELSRHQVESAYGLANQVSARRELLLGPNHRDTIDSKRVAARAQASLGDYSSSHQKLEQLLSQSRQLFGEKSLLTLRIQLNLGQTLSESPDFAQNQAYASELLANVVDEYSEKFEREDLRMIRAVFAQARHRSREGRPSSAAALLSELTEASNERIGQSHPLTIEIVRSYATILEELGRSAEAGELYAANVESCRAHFESDHSLMIQALRDLGGHYHLHRRGMDEKPILNELLAALSKAKGESHPETVDVRERLAGRSGIGTSSLSVSRP